MTKTLDELTRHAKTAAERGGEVAMTCFRHSANLVRNGKYDVKSAADNLVDQEVTQYLSLSCPEHSLFTEESQLMAGKSALDEIWLVDPIDGTNNFCFGVPYFGISVTYFSKGQPIVSCVYDPVLREVHVASRDRGAHANGTRSIARGGKLVEQNVSVVANYSENGREKGDAVRAALSSRCKRVLELWAPSMDLTRIATGMFGSMVCMDSKLLDVCAGLLILREAGGVAIDFDGRPFSYSSLKPDSSVNFVAGGDIAIAEETLRMCESALKT